MVSARSCWLVGLLALWACSSDNHELPVVAPTPATDHDLASSAAMAATDAALLRLVLVTELAGMVEPCGCSGTPRGGLDRLACAIAEARAAGPDSVLIAAGDMFFERAPDASTRQQDVWRAELLATVFGRLRFDVFAPGSSDLDHREALAALARSAPAMSWLGDPMLRPLEAPAVRPWSSSALLRIGATQVGFTVIDLALADAPLAAAERELEALRLRGAELVIAIVRAARSELVRPFAALTSADVVVYTGPESLATSTATVGHALLLDAGRRGEGVLTVDLWPGSRSAQGWQLIADLDLPAPRERVARAHWLRLDQQSAQDRQVRGELEALFARVNSYNAQHPDSLPSLPAAGSSYAGSDACAACHTRAYLWWKSTPHGQAFETLRKRGRQFDRDCIGCHVTGFGAAGGATLAEVEHVAGVGCESCHGPGSAHADNPQAARDIPQVAVPERVCLGCHDAEHSERFQYSAARAQLLTAAHGDSARR